MKITLIILFVFTFLFSFSQKEELNTTNIDFDTLYVKQFKENFYPYLFINTRNYDFFIYDSDLKDGKLYFPNVVGFMGLGVDYKWLTLSASVSLIEKSNRKGKNFSFNYGMTRRKYRLSFSYQNYEGFFHYETPEDSLGMSIDTTIEIYRPDIKNKNIQLSYFYIFNNKKASYRGSFLYFEKQIKSTGSFTVGSNVYYASFNSEQSLLPYKYDSILMQEEVLASVNNFNFSINGGGFYTLVFLKNFHISAYLALNLYYQIDLGNIKTDTPFALGVDYKGIVGFDNDKIFSGISLGGNTLTKDYTKKYLASNYFFLEFYIGKRFNLSFKKKNKLIHLE